MLVFRDVIQPHCEPQRDKHNIFQIHWSLVQTHLHQEYLMPPAPTAWPQPWQLMPRCWLLWLKETSHWAARQCFFRLMLLLVDLDHRNPTPHKPTPTRKEGLMLWVVLWTIVDTWLSAPYWNPYFWVCWGGSWVSTDLDSIKDFSKCLKTKKNISQRPKMKSWLSVTQDGGNFCKGRREQYSFSHHHGSVEKMAGYLKGSAIQWRYTPNKCSRKTSFFFLGREGTIFTRWFKPWPVYFVVGGHLTPERVTHHHPKRPAMNILIYYIILKV